VAGSKTSSPRPSSVLMAAALSCRLFAARYAMMDLCLQHGQIGQIISSRSSPVRTAPRPAGLLTSGS
jgi:hypothetical protein